MRRFMLLCAGALPVIVAVSFGQVSSAVADATPDPVIMAVGDIACDPTAPAFNGGLGTSAGCRQQAVGDVIREQQPDAFLPLGDNQYTDGTLSQYQTVYDPAMGDLKPITRPIPGNHEYNTPYGAGYYAYFGAAAHQETAGTYSYDMGGWHILAINSVKCTKTTPCGPGSPMARWIAGDIATHPSACTMAVWHHPVWSAGNHGNYAPMIPVWNQLNSYGVDMVLNGHDHLYQRFQPLADAVVDAQGVLQPPTVDPNGMVEAVVGTGGEDNHNPNPNAEPKLVSALAAAGTNPNPAVFGALKLELHPTGYDGSFMPALGTTFTDSFSGSCRAKTPPANVPTVPDQVQAARAGDGSAQVSWTTPPADPAAPATTYKATASPGTRSCTTTVGSTCKITGLTNGTEYKFIVNASNSVASVNSAQSPGLLVGMKPSRPTTPIVVLGAGTATLSWSAGYNGGLPITAFTASSTSGGKVCMTTGALSCTITGLTKGARYSFVVTATNDAGTSITSNGSTAVVAL